jgi:hypothetical protein
MSPVVICFGALDAAVMAQAAYAARGYRPRGSKQAKPEVRVRPIRERD